MQWETVFVGPDLEMYPALINKFSVLLSCRQKKKKNLDKKSITEEKSHYANENA